MDLLHLHLLLNHVPVLFLALGALVLAWGLVRKSDDVMNVGLAVVAIAALAAGGTFLTGEPAEDRLEGFAGVSHAAIEQHEESAEAALVASLITGGIALVILPMRRKRPGVVAVILLGAVAFGLMARTANLGGKIRHTELGGVTASVGADAHDDD